MSSLQITFIGTATAILKIGNVTFITDPFFSPEGTEWDVGVTTLKNTKQPALGLADLPAIHAVLLSHEDHPDNLDALGRQLLDGRHVFTTHDGASKLAPRPDVRGLTPWEPVSFTVGNVEFEITATPCQHLPGGECIGFVLSGPHFGETNGKKNAIYFTGDTVYLEELTKIKEKFHIKAALVNLGAAAVPVADPPLQITMDGHQAAQLIRDLNPGVVIPMHFDGWGHFSESESHVREVFQAEGVENKVYWLKPGQPTTIY